MKAEKRKKHILKCAKKRFAQYGFYRTQISDIIKDAKIARGTVYQYFENKQAIFITLLENTYTQWEAAVSNAIGDIDLATIHPVAYLRLRIKTTLAFLLADPDICSIVMSMGFGLPDDLEDVTRKLEEKIKDIAVNDFILGIHNKHVRPDINIEHAAEMVAGAIFRSAYYMQKKIKKNPEKADLDTLTDEVIDLFAPGIFLPSALNQQSATGQ
ncbi:MAG: TetR/AcrR family transcriptional regulator [Thermodesulfobacteriota bacterium]|nr:TetR/AcrR family transcriptional regulator [Thermodesulfobacteriota bacterium]